jgi:DNA invertase Pin-like site-specific DNA recombinase
MAPLFVGLLTGLAEVERSLIQERTKESIAHHRATGGSLGGRPASHTPEKAARGHALKANGWSVRKIAQEVGLSVSATQRLLKG